MERGVDGLEAGFFRRVVRKRENISGYATERPIMLHFERSDFGAEW
jgi:hypothetical protein